MGAVWPGEERASKGNRDWAVNAPGAGEEGAERAMSPSRWWDPRGPRRREGTKEKPVERRDLRMDEWEDEEVECEEAAACVGDSPASSH